MNRSSKAIVESGRKSSNSRDCRLNPHFITTIIWAMTEHPSYGSVIEVTDENFDAEFPNIKKTISESSFVSFDMEFTGLEVKNSYRAVDCDTVLFPFASNS